MSKEEKFKDEVKSVLTKWGYSDITCTGVFVSSKDKRECIIMDNIFNIQSLMTTMYRIGYKDKINEIKEVLDI